MSTSWEIPKLLFFIHPVFIIIIVNLNLNLVQICLRYARASMLTAVELLTTIARRHTGNM
jgi:hypothetical protein